MNDRTTLRERASRAMLGLSVMLVPAISFAQSAGVDLSEAENDAKAYGAAAVACILVFAIARWGKRAAGLANPG